MGLYNFWSNPKPWGKRTVEEDAQIRCKSPYTNPLQAPKNVCENIALRREYKFRKKLKEDREHIRFWKRIVDLSPSDKWLPSNYMPPEEEFKAMAERGDWKELCKDVKLSEDAIKEMDKRIAESYKISQERNEEFLERHKRFIEERKKKKGQNGNS